MPPLTHGRVLSLLVVLVVPQLAGAGNCTTCGDGTSCAAATDHECVCAAGYGGLATRSGDTQTCTRCQAGTFSPHGIGSCSPCNPCEAFSHQVGCSRAAVARGAARVVNRVAVHMGSQSFSALPGCHHRPLLCAHCTPPWALAQVIDCTRSADRVCECDDAHGQRGSSRPRPDVVAGGTCWIAAPRTCRCPDAPRRWPGLRALPPRALRKCGDQGGVRNDACAVRGVAQLWSGGRPQKRQRQQHRRHRVRVVR